MSRHTVKHSGSGDRPAGRVSTGLPAAANDPAEVLGKRGMLTVARLRRQIGNSY